LIDGLDGWVDDQRDGGSKIVAGVVDCLISNINIVYQSSSIFEDYIELAIVQYLKPGRLGSLGTA
jgi:hypothetical protein